MNSHYDREKTCYVFTLPHGNAKSKLREKERGSWWYLSSKDGYVPFESPSVIVAELSYTQ